MTPPDTAAPPGLMRRLGAAGPFAILLSFLPPVGSLFLIASLTQLGPWLRLHHGVGLLIYFLVIGLLLGVSFVPTYASAILAGWAFGFGKGSLIAIVTITVSSLLAYAVARWIARDRALEIIYERPKWYAIYQALVGRENSRTLLVVTLMRVPPLSPFALANFALAAARVPLGTYTLGTFLGILPRTIVTTFAAAQVEQLDLNNLGQSWVKMVGIALTLAACIGIGVLANRILREFSSSK
ncbi:MAG: VTT domain-containing protein [Pseudomonadota bacterium]